MNTLVPSNQLVRADSKAPAQTSSIVIKVAESVGIYNLMPLRKIEEDIVPRNASSERARICLSGLMVKTYPEMMKKHATNAGPRQRALMKGS